MEELSKQRFDSLVNDYLENECESEVFEVTALTDYSINGASKAGKEEFYSRYVTCTHLLKQGQAVQEKFRAFCYVFDTAKIYKFEDVTPYTLLVKK